MTHKLILRSLPWAFLATIICVLVYAAVQQDFRQSANDPQIQMAEDGAAFLARGIPPGNIIPLRKSAFRKSLWPFMTVTDTAGNILATSIEEENPPVPPKGALEFAGRLGMSRITWEPEPGVRHAIVIVPYFTTAASSTAGYVIAGRSLREVEKREANLTSQVSFAWLAAMLGTLLLVWLRECRSRRTA